MADDPIADLHDKHEENAAKIGTHEDKLDKLELVTQAWSAFLSTPVGKVVGGLLISWLTFASVWLSGKMDQKQVPVPIVVDQPVAAPHPPVDAAKPAAVNKVTYIITTATDVAILKGLPPGAVEVLSADHKLYSFNKELYPLPVAVTRDTAGQDLDVKKLP